MGINLVHEGGIIMSWQDILKDDSKEHPMERKKRLKKEKKEIRLREEAGCDCPRKPDGSHDLERTCPHKFFEKPKKENLIDLGDWGFGDKGELN